jgi:hypothetical protein
MRLLALPFSLLVFVAVFVAGCGDAEPTPTRSDTPDTTMTAVDYDKTCMVATDCILVFTGNVCGCGCTQEAIAATEGSRYATAVEAKRMLCTEVLSCQPCPDTQVATCTQGVCSAIAK